MKIALGLLVAGTLLSGAGAYQTGGKPPAAVTLTRLDCGASRAPADISAFSDTHAFDGKKRTLVIGCYLIRHGDDYLLWDTGVPAAMREDPNGWATFKATIAEQLRTLGVSPAQVGRVGISHYHDDHTGQAGAFPAAMLLIGADDWAALSARDIKPGFGAPNPAPVAHWITGGGKVEPVRGDKDVFGDGTVVMLDTPGHTPGHHALLVRLKTTGNVLLTGDLAHMTANYATNGVPSFNTNRADTLASLDRFKAMARTLNARVVIQHEPADVAKLPAFPQAAE